MEHQKSMEFYMQRAMELAEKGCGWTNPNPMVGAVIEKEGRIIGEGYHERYGELHAERNALAHCSEDPKGATLYVTLEPCCHQGKQPPCTEAILKSGISRVVIGSKDPNPLVSGKGIQILSDHGVEVITGILKTQCDAMNEVFFHYMKTGMPWVVMKYAMTLDGKIATYTGKSQWITGELARKHVHRQRHRYMAIMVGIGTVLSDNPMLTCRMEGGKNPIRIICDTNLRIPMDCNLVKSAKEIPTIIATASEMTEKQKKLLDMGCEIINPGMAEGHLDLKKLMQCLAQRQIDSVYLEGGQTLNWSALNSGIVNRVNAYIAPKIFGGAVAASPVGGAGVEMPDAAFHLKNIKWVQLGEDYMMEGDLCLQESLKRQEK